MKQSRELTEAEIAYKWHMLENLKLQVDSFDIDIRQLQSMLDLKLPERQVRNTMMQKLDQKANAERNIKVVEKQIREKKEVILENEEPTEPEPKPEEK
jgi:hypothetical protein